MVWNEIQMWRDATTWALNKTGTGNKNRNTTMNVGKKAHKENFKHVFHRPVRRKLQATQLNSSASYSEMWTKGGLVSVQVIVPVFI